jgi:hypothetical protein
MKRVKREVSDKVVFVLLVVAFVISALGGYIVYDYSHNSGDEQVMEDEVGGMVILNVVGEENSVEEVEDNEGIE